MDDFRNLKIAIRNEFSRRSLALPTDDTYAIEPAPGVIITKEHMQKVYDDIHKIDSSFSYTIPIGSPVVADTIVNNAIAKIQELMFQNIK